MAKQTEHLTLPNNERCPVEYDNASILFGSKLKEISSLDICVGICCNFVFYTVLSPADRAETEIDEIPLSHTLIKVRTRAIEL